MDVHRRDFLRLSGAASSVLLATPLSAAAPAVIPAAAIRGPIPVVAGSNEPFRGNNEQPVAGPGLPPPSLIPFGYVEEEYVVSGLVDGRPYATSLLVRKPGDPKRFSGLVAVEAIHAGGAVPFWGTGRQSWMPGGHAWVAVMSQRATLETHARKANPARYASLEIPDMGGDAQSASRSGPESNPQDLVSQAIMSQVGQLLKNNDPQGPLRGLTVRKLVMGGSSQTGGTTLRYIQYAHDKARRPNGKPIYDGYMPTLAFSERPVTLRDAPIMHIVVEGDLMNALSGKRTISRRPDGDAAHDRYRLYELAGASHVVTRGMRDASRISAAIQRALRPGDELNQFPNVPFFTRFTDAFVDWVMHGKAPPHADRIAMADGDIVRDAHGNALGGIRSPYVDLPTVRYLASAAGSEGIASERRLMGTQEPLPPAELRRLYSSKNDYLRRFDAGIDALVAGSWVRAADADKLKQEERDNPALVALA